ncbi:MAG: GDSL-type esterase/lipase family protein [Acidimicrobiia bacterium]
MRRLLALAPAVPLAAMAAVAGRVLFAAHRSDLPSFPNQDASGTFGDRSKSKLRIVAVGDSSLTAPGVEDLDDVWIRRIAHHLTDRYWVELISLGVGGARAREVLNDQLPAAVELEPDIAVVAVGANDAIRATPLAGFEANLHHIVGRLHEASGAIVVLGMGDLGSIPRLPRAVRPYLRWRSRRFDDAWIRTAASFPRAVKVHTRDRMTTAFYEDVELFAGDQFHASAKGHAVFAEESIPAFETALGHLNVPS